MTSAQGQGQGRDRGPCGTRWRRAGSSCPPAGSTATWPAWPRTPQDRVYVFNRSEHPVIVYDRDGRSSAPGARALFTRAHGITITGRRRLLRRRRRPHRRRVHASTGACCRRWGRPPALRHRLRRRAGQRCDHPAGGRAVQPPHPPAVAPSGDLYVSDGYGNARVHRFSPAGELLQSWGEPGRRAGPVRTAALRLGHTDGRVFVCDRENDRVQIFDPAGELLTAWTDVTRPADLFIDRDGRVYVGELACEAGATSRWPAGAGRRRARASSPCATWRATCWPAGAAPTPAPRTLRLPRTASRRLTGGRLRRRGHPDRARPQRALRPGYPSLKKFVRRT